MEPQYIGNNGSFRPEAALWLLANDHVFFRPEEIAWDGTHHKAIGMQVNAANVDGIPNFMSDLQRNVSSFAHFINSIENDSQLMVDIGEIHGGLHGVLRGENLTGITLLNLIACNRAWKLLDGDEAMRIANSIPSDDEGFSGATYLIMHDTRLAMGIPSFYKLIARLVWDMRCYEGIDGAYRVQFIAARNIDADAFLDDVENMVEGADSRPFAKLDVDGEPVVKLGLLDGLSALLGNPGPSQPSSEKLTFNNGARHFDSEAVFSVAVPDGFRVGDGSEVETFIFPNLFTLVPEKDGPIFSYVRFTAFGNEDMLEVYQEQSTPDLMAAMKRGSKCTDSLHTIQDRKIRGVNCDVVVALTVNENMFGKMYDIVAQPLMPMSAPFNNDYLKMVCNAVSESDRKEAFETLCELAKTIELKEPFTCGLLRRIASWKTSKVAYGEFEEGFETLSQLCINARNLELEHARKNAVALKPVCSQRDEVFAQAAAMTTWAEENLGYLQLCLEVYEAQVRLGSPRGDLVKMHAYLEEFDTLYRMNIGHEGDEWDVEAKKAGVLRIPEGLESLEARWRAVKAGEAPAPAPTETEKREALKEKERMEAEKRAAVEAEQRRAAEEEKRKKDEEERRKAEVHAIASKVTAAYSGIIKEDVRMVRIESDPIQKEVARIGKELEGVRADEAARDELYRRQSAELGSIDALKAELSSLGVFAFGKKKDLAARIEAEERRAAETGHAIRQREEALAQAVSSEKLLADLKREENRLEEARNRERDSRSRLDGDIYEVEIDERDVKGFLKDSSGNTVGFVFVGADGVMVECYYAKAREERFAAKGFSSDDLRLIEVLAEVGKMSPAAFDKLESDPVAGPVISNEPSLKRYTKKGREQKKSKKGDKYLELAKKVLTWMPSDRPVLTSEIMENVNGVMTSQMCTKVMNILIEAGKVSRVEKVKGRYIGYKLLQLRDPGYRSGPLDEASLQHILEASTEDDRPSSSTAGRYSDGSTSYANRAAAENEELARKVLMWMPADRPVLTSEIMENVNGIMTSQKCTKVMETLIAAGRVEKVDKVRGRYIGYRLI